MYLFTAVMVMVAQFALIMMQLIRLCIVLVVTKSVETHSNSLFSLKSAPNDFK